MIRKVLLAAALAGLCTLGTEGAAVADDVPVQPQGPEWIPVLYFGPQSFCMQAGAMGEQMGSLTAGSWQCDAGWLMVHRPKVG